MAPDGVSEELPLAVDVGHLELELRGDEPGVRCLRPKLAELHLAQPLLVLLKAGSTQDLWLLLVIFHLVLYKNVHRE